MNSLFIRNYSSVLTYKPRQLALKVGSLIQKRPFSSLFFFLRCKITKFFLYSHSILHKN